jgi:hypothetical protein
VYRLLGNSSEQTIIREDSPGFEETVVSHLKIVGQGALPNEQVNVFYHITVNANGDTTTEVDHTTTKCK